jgi:Polysaccharide lyase
VAITWPGSIQAIIMLRTLPAAIVLSLLLQTTELSSAGAQPDLVENFEKGDLNPHLWSQARLPLQRAWIYDGDAREGANSLAIRVKGSDLDKSCNCQRIEVREAPQQRLPFGSDSWYAFSFRVEGQPPLTGSQRWVIAAWKQEAEGGPFLAQRFDEGVFHITLESGAHRVLLASTKGEVRSFAEQLQSGLLASFSFISDPELYGGKTDVTIEYGDDPKLPDPRKNWVDMLYHVRGALDGKGLVEIYANGKFIVRAKGTIGVPGPAAMRQYLRLGHNRAPMPGTSTIFFDRIRRGTSRADVE